MQTTQEMRQKFDRDIYNWARDLTTRELTGTKAWLIGIEIINISRSFDLSYLTVDFLDNELQLSKSHFAVDGHNWSNFYRLVNKNSINIIEALKARKLGA
jgi:hypothetical protein